MKHAGAPYSGAPALCLFNIAAAEQIREAAGDIVHFSFLSRIIERKRAWGSPVSILDNHNQM